MPHDENYVYVVMIIGYLNEGGGGAEVLPYAYANKDDAIQKRDEVEANLDENISDPDFIYDDYEVRIDELIVM